MILFRPFKRSKLPNSKFACHMDMDMDPFPYPHQVDISQRTTCRDLVSSRVRGC